MGNNEVDDFSLVEHTDSQAQGQAEEAYRFGAVSVGGQAGIQDAHQGRVFKFD